MEIRFVRFFTYPLKSKLQTLNQLETPSDCDHPIVFSRKTKTLIDEFTGRYWFRL